MVDAVLNVPLSTTIHRLPRRNRYVVASIRDQDVLAGSPLGDLIVFVDPDAGADGLQGVFPLLGVAVSDAGSDALRVVLKQLRKLRSVPDVPVLRLQAAALASEAELVSQVLEGGLGRLSRHMASANAELATLRRERETLFENYRALENAFHARNWDTVTEVFAHDPFVDPKDQGLTTLLCETEIVQLFPISSYAVSGFALHFREVPADKSGRLIAVLDYVESSEGIAEWLIPYESVTPGWNFFSLPKACDGSPRTLRLKISASGGIPPELSLGHVITNERYTAQARTQHADLDMRPLALRIFTGIPGTRPTALPNVFAPSTAISGRKVQDYRLPVELLRAVANVSASPIEPSFQTVRFLELEDAIGCHPLNEGITAGAVRRVVAPGTARISARAVIDHPEGKPATVGLMLVPLSADMRREIAALAEGRAVPPAAFFSGWTEITAAAAVDINFMLETPTTRTMNLVVLSKAAADSVDFAWLKVFNFRLVKYLESKPAREVANA